MTDPRRLLDGRASECSPFEAHLLRAGRDEAMSAACKRALVASALGGGLAAAAAATTAAAPGQALAMAKGGTSVLAKWMVLGLVGTGLAVAASAFVARSPAPLTTPAPVLTPPPSRTLATASVQASPPPPSAPLRAPSVPGPSGAPSVPADSPPTPRASVSALGGPGSPPSASAPRVLPEIAEGDLAAETALLEEARDAVTRRDGEAALAVLAQHSRAFPRPALADEAFVLRVEALAAQGDGARLRALAAPWLASHPASPYAPRVRRALAQATATPPAGATP